MSEVSSSDMYVRVLRRPQHRLPRQAEVQDLHDPGVRHEEILRLEIAVDDSLVVRRRQAACHLQRVVH